MPRRTTTQAPPTRKLRRDDRTRAGLVVALPDAPAVTRPDPVESARAAGCRYVDDSIPGIRRLRHGKSFRFVSPAGKPVRDAATLKRIRSLVIPPAWTQLWICPDERGHIQATGRDARGRKQYRYHPRFREVRDETKYGRMLAFAAVLPAVRARVDEDMARPGLHRDRVLATVVRLLESTLIRVGNEEYARENGSFGLTTLRTRHVAIEGSTIEFRFRGKSGVRHTVSVQDRRVARVLQRCCDLPGEELFQYLDDQGSLRSVESCDVNEYLARASGGDFTAKDFRTWAGTVLTAAALREVPTFESATQAKRNVVEAIKRVCARLGNTPSVCRKCYVHPAVLSTYLEGSLAEALASHAPAKDRALSGDESAVLALLAASAPYAPPRKAEARVKRAATQPQPKAPRHARATRSRDLAA